MADEPKGFVSLKALKRGDDDPKAALDELRTIYFKTTKQTIDNDLIHAIELFKQLREEDQDKGAHYMEGIGQMRREWAGKKKATKKKAARSKKSKVKSEK